jgi:hypothetical protein
MDFNTLHGVVNQKMRLFIITAVSILNPKYIKLFCPWLWMVFVYCLECNAIELVSRIFSFAIPSSYYNYR